MSNSRSTMEAPSLSTADVARRLGVSVPTVQRWVDLGHLKAWKTVGGHRRIDAASAQEFIRRQAGRAPGALAPATQALSVLVVEDNPVERELLCELVGQALPGARVRAAHNGFEALLAIGKETPDLVVTDIAMPHMNGVEMIRHLAGGAGARAPAVVAVSSHTPAQVDALGGLPLGVRLLAKPIDPAVLAAAIALALEVPAARPARGALSVAG